MDRHPTGWLRSLVAVAVVLSAGVALPATRVSASSCSGSQAGSCQLTFVAEPANALRNSNITSQGFDPSGAPVSVRATDATGHPVNHVTVSLSLLQSGTSATLSGPVTATTDSTGVVTFGSPSKPLSVDQTGYYQLQASAGASGFPRVASLPVFYIADTVKSCSGKSCSAVPVSGASSSASATVLNATGDLISMGLGGFQYSCGSYQAVSGVIGTDVWQTGGNAISGASAQTAIEIFKSVVDLTPNNGASFYQICYASTQTFTTLSGGAPATVTLQISGSGSVTFFVGLLPDCGNTKPAPVPCVASRSKDKSGDVVISFFGTGDFYGQG
jgi:hypothetical protein